MLAAVVDAAAAEADEQEVEMQPGGLASELQTGSPGAHTVSENTGGQEAASEETVSHNNDPSVLDEASENAEMP